MQVCGKQSLSFDTGL